MHQETILGLIPAIRMMLSGNALKVGKFIPLEDLFDKRPEELSLRLGRSISVFPEKGEALLEAIEKAMPEVGQYLFLQNYGLLGLSNNKSQVEQKISMVRKEGPEGALPESVPVPQIPKALYNKVIAVTGAAMGYGEGIARQLFAEGANLLLLDINEALGKQLADKLNASKSPNRALFVPTDVTDLNSVQKAVYKAVLEFAGLDVMISNAGVLKAGAIEDLEPGDFEFVNKVNYTGYYNCIKATVPVMRAQNAGNPQNYGDIIQINSKSGLEGSLKNFAYSGSKFAGMGLTQSLAMDLMPERIKVNAICPGNFFEGPLWSHPEKGLFKQYLEAGKAPGAKTIADVKRFYESKVPAGRGCRIEDVVKAIKYVIDQEYETGQAIPVTGGQVMLS